jgi:hypothetical protein
MVAVVGGAGVGAYYLRAQAPVPKSEKPPEDLNPPLVLELKPLEPPLIAPHTDEPLKRPDVAASDKKEAGKPEERFQKLLKARRDMAEQEWGIRWELYRAGANEPGMGNPVTLHMLTEATKHLLKADLELSKRKTERLEARERYLKRMKAITNVTEAQYKAGRVSSAAFASALYEQLDADIELEREKAR